MKTKLYPVLFLLFLVLTFYPCSKDTLAQENTERYFPETGHTVSGVFFTKYQSVAEPITVFGYPITDAFQDQATGRQIQFFQRALFEYDTQSNLVSTIPLGQELYQLQGETELTIPFNITACRYFAETNKQICYSFLDFYNKYGGLEQFGYPISNIGVQNSRIVQYFQYARFEWRPEFPSGERVLLSDLGSTYFEQGGYDSILLRPSSSSSNIPGRVLNLHISAFIARAEAEDSRTLYVITSVRDKDFLIRLCHYCIKNSLKFGSFSTNPVILSATIAYPVFTLIIKDQNQQLVPGITIDFAIRIPDGSEKSFIMPLPTNQFGFSYTTFNIDQFPPNRLIELIVRVNHQGLIKETSTAFWTW